jgi:UDP-perosamine 4-acetyltransferase
MKQEVIVLGAGGHAKVCIELLRASSMSVAFCIGGHDDSQSCLGVPVLRGDDHLLRLRGEGYLLAFIAVGSNASRQRLAGFAQGIGYELVNAISPAAIISPSVQMGKGIAVMAGAVINAEACVSDLAIVNTSATIDHDSRIGEAAHLAPQCGLAGNVTVGARAFLGIGTRVIPGVCIGSDVVAGAGSVIISDIESGSRVAGVPARKINERTKPE